MSVRSIKKHFFVAPIAVLVMIAGCKAEQSDREALPYLNQSSDVLYVGSAECASCHEGEHAGYQEHGMAQAFYRITDKEIVEAFPSQPVGPDQRGLQYRAIEVDGMYFQEEFRLGVSGEEEHRLRRRIDYVVGSGSAARTYLTEENGQLYELPLTWYTQANDGRGKWDFSPGYREGNARFSRDIPERCMTCHNGVSVAEPYVPGRFVSLGNSIGCERCHGPGGLHVEARLEDPEAPDSIDYTIVNPAHLPVDLRLDVCNQCHTNGDVSVLREGATATSYRPGQPLSDHLAIFGSGAEGSTSTIGVISHSDRMMQSECFVQSASMDCVTCHNPHQGFRDQGPEYFNSTCQQCHAVSSLKDVIEDDAARLLHNAESDCFSCHMPKVEAEDAPHSSFTDHFIRVISEDESVGEGLEATTELVPFFERDLSSDDKDVYLGMASVVLGRLRGESDLIQRGVTMLSQTLSDRVGFGEAHYLQGFAELQLGRSRNAIPPLERSVELGPDIPERLNTLAQALEQTGSDRDRINSLYARAIEIQPLLADVRINYGRFLEASGDTQGALVQYTEAIAAEPYNEIGHFNLGTLLLKLGDVERGAQELREAVHLNPDNAEALTNLGVLSASAGRMADAQIMFERAVRSDPRNANAHANIGVFYLQQGEFTSAVSAFSAAVELAPSHVDAMANLAVAHAQLGNVQEAVFFLERALSINPSHPMALELQQAIAQR